jgi:hypothetical protein
MVRAGCAYGGIGAGTLAMAMSYLLVLLLSLLVGVGAYVVTVRGTRPDASLGFGEDEEEEELADAPGDPPRSEGPRPGYAYLQVSTRGPDLRDRVLGLIGLVLLVAISMAVLAFAIYEVGHLINRTIEAFLE